MKNYKKVAAVVITAVAITGSASALASASFFAPSNKEAIITSTLGIDATTLRNRIQAGETLAAIAGAKKDALIAALVADETKQIDAAVAAGKLTAEKAATLKSNLTAHVTQEVNAVHGPGMGGGMGGKGGPGMDGPRGGFGPGNMETVITATLGIDASTLRTRLAAGESLATIAGAKKDALIAALIAEHTKQIDAAVAAGKLTAEKAATLKSNLTAHVTEEVNAVHGPGMGGKGGPRMDGPRGGFGPGNLETVVTGTLGIDATTLRNRLTAGESLATIAGAKKDALIAALVAEHTKQIDTAVAAGKLTADQAKNLKANLTAHITEEVNEVHTPGMGGKGGRGHGHGRGDGDGDHGNGMGLPKGSTNGIPNTSNSNN